MYRTATKTISILSLAATCLACGGRADVSDEAAANSGRPKVVVVTRPSEFKSQIVERLADDYGGRTHITHMDISELKRVDEDAFDAHLASAHCKDFDAQVRDWIEHKSVQRFYLQP